jgi:hypothetical protein
MPQQKPFTTMGQVEAYLSQPRIKCLVCGTFFKSLGMHLHFRHGMTADDYRMRFGIPFVCALAAPDVLQYMSRSQQERAAQDPAYAERRAQHLARGRAAQAARTVAARRCPTEPDPLARLDDALLLSMSKAERMRQLRATLADGAAERAQARKERREHEREYRQAYKARKARTEAA